MPITTAIAAVTAQVATPSTSKQMMKQSATEAPGKTPAVTTRPRREAPARRDDTGPTGPTGPSSPAGRVRFP